MSAESQARSNGQVTARANLLAGLRGGRQSRSGSPAQQEQTTGPTLSPSSAARLKANAPVFTPGVSGGVRQVTTPPATGDDAPDYMGALEAQLAALQMSAMQSTSTIAASYGATQGQPQQRPAGPSAHQKYLANEQAVAQFLLQRQQQQQQQQQLQAQLAHEQYLEQLRAQATFAQAGQQQNVAHQQRALFAQIQQEYEQQLRFKAALEAQQEREQQLAAQEQRQAAQASLQASTRNRQVQKLYAQLLEEDEAGRLDPRMLAGRDLWQVALDAVTEQHQQAQLVAATQEQIRQLQFQQYALHLQQLQQQQANANAEADKMYRCSSLSPAQQRQGAVATAQGQQRERVPSSADQAVNWRSRPAASPRDELLPTAGLPLGDDSVDSVPNESSPRSSRSFNSNRDSADDTPQTSEEDIDVRSAPAFSAKASVSSFKARVNASPSPSATLSPANGRSPQPAFARGGGLKASSASTSGGSRPRSAENRDDSGFVGSSSFLAATVLPASRQPRGPPTDFTSANFAARMNARTRKQALSKLREMASGGSRGGAAAQGAGAGSAPAPAAVDCC